MSPLEAGPNANETTCLMMCAIQADQIVRKSITSRLERDDMMFEAHPTYHSAYYAHSKYTGHERPIRLAVEDCLMGIKDPRRTFDTVFDVMIYNACWRSVDSLHLRGLMEDVKAPNVLPGFNIADILEILDLTIWVRAAALGLIKALKRCHMENMGGEVNE